MSLRRRSPRRTRPGLDWLESRSLLSGSTSSFPELSGPTPQPPGELIEPADEFGVANVTPGLAPEGGAITNELGSSPSEIAITFSQPIDPTMLPYGMSPVWLYRVVDGAPTDSIFDAAPPVSVNVEDGDTRIVVKLDPTQPLAPGTYRLVIPAGMPILSTDYVPLPGSDVDVVLGDFAVAQPEAAINRSQAIDLGTVSPAPIHVDGSLDLVARPHDVALYKIQIPNNIEQSAWRLGMEVRSADGSSLHSGLTLFDDQGRPLASSILGRPSSPGDPYLFAGVEPGGTYYVGISSYLNVPGQPGGYEIESESGSTGGNAETQSGGGFVISLVADPIDASVKVSSFQLNHADPLDATPSGFTIGFNGAVEPGSTVDPITGNPISILKLVDSRGHTYDLTLASFDETNARLTFLFPTRLPAGSYSVMAPAMGGLTDLIGHLPRTDGLPLGTLARFDVSESALSDGLNIGVIYPGDSSRASLPSLTIEPGAAADVRFVAAAPGLFQLSTTGPSERFSLELITPDGNSRAVDSSMSTGVDGVTLNLTATGVYHLRIASAGTETMTVGVVIAGQRTDADSLIRSGIGQGSALELRLVSYQPPTAGPPTTSSPSPTTPSPTAPGVPPTTDPNVAPSGFADPAGPSPSSITSTETGPGGQMPTSSAMGESLTATSPSNGIPVVNLGGQLVGRPDSRADRVAIVAGTAGTGSTGLAANQPLLPLGLIVNPSRFVTPEQPEQAEPDPQLEGFQNGAIVHRRGDRGPGEAAQQAEESVANAAAPGTDWVDQALAALGNLLAPERAAEAPSVVDEGLIASIDQEIGDSGESESSDTSARHQIGLIEPAGLTLLIAALTQQGRRVLRHRESDQSRKSTAKPTPRTGPHHGRLSGGRAPAPPRSAYRRF